MPNVQLSAAYPGFLDLMAAIESIPEEDAIETPVERDSTTVTWGVDEVPPDLLEVAKSGPEGWKLVTVRTEWPWVEYHNINNRRILVEFIYHWDDPNSAPASIPFIHVTRGLTQVSKLGRIWSLTTGSYDRVGYIYVYFKPSRAFVARLIRQRTHRRKA